MEWVNQRKIHNACVFLCPRLLTVLLDILVQDALSGRCISGTFLTLTFYIKCSFIAMGPGENKSQRKCIFKFLLDTKYIDLLSGMCLQTDAHWIPEKKISQRTENAWKFRPFAEISLGFTLFISRCYSELSLLSSGTHFIWLWWNPVAEVFIHLKANWALTVFRSCHEVPHKESWVYSLQNLLIDILVTESFFFMCVCVSLSLLGSWFT